MFTASTHPRPPRLFHTAIVLSVLVISTAAGRAADKPPTKAGLAFFEQKIRPVLVKQCYGCHSGRAKKIQGKFRLDSRQLIRKGGPTGPAIVPGKPAASLLLDAIRYESLEMPPGGRLPKQVVADFETWVRIGAPDPRDKVRTDKVEKQQGMSFETARRWWSFQPVATGPLPQTKRKNWAQKRLDHFVLAQLETHQLEPSPRTDRRALLRRLKLDLLGLPPTQAEISEFENDRRPDATSHLVDRLLASRHYGERWGRHWLDVARWAEDNPTSEATNRPHPDGWRYRDWVIEAINADLPYDRFLLMQLAADLLPGFQRSDLRALGYLGTAPTYHKDPRLSKSVIETIATDDWDERVDALSRGLLGLTVACARCHRHKFDAITQQDYYSLAGVFASNWKVKRPLVELTREEERRVIWAQDRLWRLEVAISLKSDPATPSTPDEISAMKAELALLKQTPFLDAPATHAVYDAAVFIDASDPDFTWMDFRIGQHRDLPVFLRGNVNTPGPVTPRRFLQVLSPDQKPRSFADNSGRLELARAITTTAAPLAARVFVNRVWGWHFGRPLVTTASDFGAQGNRPSHPRLLDDLAAGFIANGWSLKWLHREIVLAATYSQSSRYRQQAATSDPVNRWLWRYPRRRIDFETWRDSILAVTGALDTKPFGPSQDIADAKNLRRTVYATVSRRQVSPLMRLYDFPDVSQHVPGRNVTTTPLQQLFVLNSNFFIDQAATLAKHIDPKSDAPDNIVTLYQRVFARQPSREEIRIANTFLESRRRTHPATAWADYCQALLATSELIFVD